MENSEFPLAMISGEIYLENGDVQRAIKGYEEACKIAKTVNEHASSRRMVGICQRLLSNHESENTLFAALNFAAAEDDNSLLANLISMDIGMIYTDKALAQHVHDNSHIDHAIELFEKSFNFFTANNFTDEAITSQILLGRALLIQGRDTTRGRNLLSNIKGFKRPRSGSFLMETSIIYQFSINTLAVPVRKKSIIQKKFWA